MKSNRKESYNGLRRSAFAGIALLAVGMIVGFGSSSARAEESAESTTIVPAAASTSATLPTFKITTDSASILMGNTLDVNLHISQNDDVVGFVEVDEDALQPIEIVEGSRKQLVPHSLGKGKFDLTATYKIQAFDSGDYELPPMRYVYKGDTVYSNSVTLNVRPVDVSDMEGEIVEIEPQMEHESRWFDWMPDWITNNIWIIVIIIGAAALITLIAMILTKRIKVRILPKKPETPPHIVAMKKLKQLKDSDLWEAGREKQFYTELTDILREYLQRRFGINAMEMTSRQIVKAISDNEDTKMSKEFMAQILEIADYVKFAKAQTLRDQNIRSFENAVKFIDATRPVANPEHPNANTPNDATPSTENTQPRDSKYLN